MVSSVISALDGECLCISEISINVNKLLAVLLFPVYLIICFFILRFFVTCLLLNPIFYTGVIVACLLPYLLFYIAIFLFIS